MLDRAWLIIPDALGCTPFARKNLRSRRKIVRGVSGYPLSIVRGRFTAVHPACDLPHAIATIEGNDRSFGGTDLIRR
jgi:hypothetical protein